MIELAVEVTDNGTRNMLEEMLASEEEHQHWLESQLELIRQVGEPELPHPADSQNRITG